FYTDLTPTAYANTNFGGSDVESNSGILKYVRIEFAGRRINNNDYFNGLLLAAVGSQTVIDNIMVSYSAGNSFEVQGGNIDLNKLISYRSSGNDFKFNYGANSKLKNSLAVRSPYVSSSYGARCIQVASYNKKEEVDLSEPGTILTAENITLVTDSDNIKTDIEKGLVKEAIYVGQNSSLNMASSVISGFNPAVLFEETIVINQANLEKIRYSNMFFNNCNGNIFVAKNSNNEDLEKCYGN